MSGIIAAVPAIRRRRANDDNEIIEFIEIRNQRLSMNEGGSVT